MKKAGILLGLLLTGVIVALAKSGEKQINNVEPQPDNFAGMSPLLRYGILGEGVDPNRPHDAFQNW